ncbi:MAG TPA: hypothetical protein VMU07_00990 [Candidatus Paceibacterota bacterium]|nr:hypothetical protein [Candidatus Paceibacterota bacterium]
MKKLLAAAAVIIPAFFPFATHAAQIYLDPATGKYPPGVTFGVDVRIDNQGQCVNAAEVDIAFPPNILHAVSASDGNSIFSLWVKEPTIYQSYGIVSFVGGLPGGYCGRVSGDPALSNKLATIYFQFPTSTAAGSSTFAPSAALSFESSTIAILNDGAGTIAPLKTAGAVYSTLTSGKYAPVNTWQDAIQNDAAPPEPFTVGVYRDQSLFSNQWFAAFSTVDKQTGIDHYEVAEVPLKDVNTPQSQWNWARAVSPYLIHDQSLSSVIAVRAIDAAGNVRVETFTPSTQPSKNQWPYLNYVAIIGIVGIIVWQFVIHLL